MNDLPRYAEVTSEEFYAEEAQSAEFQKEYNAHLDSLPPAKPSKCPECGNLYEGEFHCGFFFPILDNLNY